MIVIVEEKLNEKKKNEEEKVLKADDIEGLKQNPRYKVTELEEGKYRVLEKMHG